MSIESWLPLIRQQRAIAVIRCQNMALGEQMAKAVAAGGMQLIEITWNSDRPAELIDRLRAQLSDCWIGAGTLLNQEHLKTAIAAGAQFLFTPHTATDLIHLAMNYDVPLVPGALSPSEIVQAWHAGAKSIKVFPVQALGGADYIRSLQGPLGQIALIPTGGVTVTNAPEFLQAGAIAVGLSGSLFPSTDINEGNWSRISQRVSSLLEKLHQI